MDYCILVELSRESIALYYYDSTVRDKFLPLWEEPVVPLAIWFNGNDATIGQTAKTEASRRNPQAFDHLFDKLSLRQTFHYANEDHDYNKLVLYALRTALREFLIRIKYNRLGDLDKNMATMPLVLAMDSDLKVEERGFVMKCLRDNGFGNVMEINQASALLQPFDAQIQHHGRYTALVSGSGESLYVTLYDGMKERDAFQIQGGNVDPRLRKLVQLIWDKTQAEFEYLTLDREYKVIEQAALRFLSSDAVEQTSAVTLSDGNQYGYFVNRNEIRLFDRSEGENVQRLLSDHLSNIGASVKNTTVVLANQAASNSYLYGIFNKSFPCVIPLVGDNKDKVLANILAYCRRLGFSFPKSGNAAPKPDQSPKAKPQSQAPAEQPGSKTQRGPEPQPWGEPEAIDDDFDDLFDLNDDVNGTAGVQDEPEVVEVVDDDSYPVSLDSDAPAQREPDAKDKKAFRELKAEVKAYRECGNTLLSRKLIENFQREMHERDIYAFDQEIAEMLGGESGKSTTYPDLRGGKKPQRPTPEPSRPAAIEKPAKPAAQPSAEPASPEPTTRDKWKLRCLNKDVSKMMIDGEFGRAMDEINAFADELHSRGIFEFDSVLHGLEMDVTNSQPRTYDKNDYAVSGPSGQHGTVVVEQEDEKVHATQEDRKKLRMLQREVTALLKSGSPAAARKAVHDFHNQLVERGVTELDKQIDNLFNYIKTYNR